MTKRELASRVLRLLGVNTRFSEANPQEIEDTIKYMEDWMLSNDAVGRRIGWVVSGDEVNPDEESGIPDWAVMGVTNSVAEMVAPYFNKPVHSSILKNAAIGMQTISSMTVELQPMQYPRGFPRGTGSSTPYGPKYFHPENRIVTGGDFLTDEGDEPITT